MMKRSCFCLAMIFSFFLFFSSPALRTQAIPSLPSSFYGTVKMNGSNVLNGTIIQVVINGRVVGQCLTLTYQGDSVYSIDVPGDNPETSVLDGGVEGNNLYFMIGGAPANQTGTWHGASNVRLNLTISTSSTLKPTLPSFTPVFSITPIQIVPVTSTWTHTPSPTSTPISASATQTMISPTIQPSRTLTKSPVSLPRITPTQTRPPAASNEAVAAQTGQPIEFTATFEMIQSPAQTPFSPPQALSVPKSPSLTIDPTVVSSPQEKMNSKPFLILSALIFCGFVVGVCCLIGKKST